MVRSVMADPQIGVDHILVVAHLVRGAVTDLFAVVHNNHAVGQVHDHTHVMFDQGDGGAELIVHIQDKAGHVLFFLDVHACHRLIQQQQLWLCCQRTCQFDPFLETIRQTGDRSFADRLDLQEVDDPLDHFAVFRLFGLGLAPPKRLLHEIGLHVVEATGHDIVQNAHAVKQRDILEGPGDTLARDLIGAHGRPFGPTEPDFALLRNIKAGNNVQH
mmetsp:Transcript_833/g.1141  ORF Transcript_833/g.1141 Transcript_833/m.1141 type:complete len:216 (-) Transcript_833:2320-2967(-)